MAARCGDKSGCLVWVLIFVLAGCANAIPEEARGVFFPARDDAHDEVNGGLEDAQHILSDHLPHSVDLNEEDESSNTDSQARTGTTLVEGGNIELGLTLTAPFFNVPISTMTSQYDKMGKLIRMPTPSIIYDLGGFVMAGAMTLATIFLLPKFLPPADKPGESHMDDEYPNNVHVDELDKFKNAHETSNNFASMFSRLNESLLSNYNINMTACAHRIICSSVKTARDGVSNGRPTAIDSFMHVLTKTPILRAYLPSSWRDMADMAWSADNLSNRNAACDDVNIYKRCPVNADIAKMLFQKLAPISGIV